MENQPGGYYYNDTVEDDAPIGKHRVTCVRCCGEFECAYDDAFGFDPDDGSPVYMCGTCQRQRHFDHAA